MKLSHNIFIGPNGLCFGYYNEIPFKCSIMIDMIRQDSFNDLYFSYTILIHY